MRYEEASPEYAKAVYETAKSLHEQTCAPYCQRLTSFEDWQSGWQDAWIDLAAETMADD